MEERFERLIDFTLKKEALAGKARVLFPSAEQWKKFIKEKNDLAIQYELIMKKSPTPSADGKEAKRRTDYSSSLTLSIKEPKKRFAKAEAREKFPHMSQLCLMNCGVDIVILVNPHELSTLPLAKQSEAIVRELLHYEEHRTGKLFPVDLLTEKAKKIVGEFLSQGG